MGYQNKQWHCQESSIRFFGFKVSVIVFLLFLFITMSVCYLKAQAISQSPSVQIINPISVSSGSQSKVMHHMQLTQLPVQNYALNVFFSKPNATNNVFGATFSVKRVAPLVGHTTSLASLASYAIQQLIVGPTSAERRAGFESILQQAIFGKSTCAGEQNFILTLDKKGTLTRPGVATIKFCRQIFSAGIGMDAGIRAEVESTLKQFPSIKRVVILSSEGHCFGDASGDDFCLR